ncbi:MAG: hypothetical protein H6Q15_183 [Bacteroidetes bacterium]|nr:hypothetical protein [Bacteroidota bacterium]
MMKKIITSVFAILFSVIAFSQTVPFGQGYIINGEIAGENNGFVTLRSFFRDGNEKVDTCFIENGTFTFRSPVENIIPAQLSVNGLRGFRIYLEPSTYIIKINPLKASETSIKGSKSTDDWYNVTNALKDEDYDVHMRRLENWVLNNPTNIFCSDVISSFLSYNWGYDELNKTLNTLLKPASQTYHYLKLREREEGLSTVAIGKKAPDFTLASVEGGNINLRNHLRGKKLLLIDFWASWCKPCREENPNVVVAFEKYQDKGFSVLGVSLDKDKTAWKNAIANDKLSWAHVSDLKMWNNEVAKKYFINSIPANVLVDENGVIIARNLKGTDLIDKLEELTNSYGFEINGNITGIDDGKVKLNLLLEGGQKKTLTTDIIDGKFKFSGVVDFVCMGQISLPTKNGDISFFMENSKISITGTKDNLENVSIKGSPQNDNFSSIVEYCNSSKNPLQTLTSEVVKRPNSFYAPLIISNYLAPYISNIELKKAVNALDGDAKKMFQYKLLVDYVAEMEAKEKVGEKAIDFVLPDVNGVDVSMLEFIKTKKYVLIDFWASWCVPCRNESKYLTQAYQKFNKHGFDILGVSLDKYRDNWLKGISEDGLIWTNVSDLKQWNSVVVKLYKLESIPQNILVDSQGNIIARNLRGDNLISTLNELFAK